MAAQYTIEERVQARHQKLMQSLERSPYIATSKVARGNVYLLMGKYATEQDLKVRLNRLSRILAAFK